MKHKHKINKHNNITQSIRAMKIRFLLTLLVAGVLTAAAQDQGYKDGIEYYKAGFPERARVILTRTLNNADTDKALANYYLGQASLSLDDKAAAAKYFAAGVAADAENPYNYVGQGALALMNGNDSEAKDYFKQAQKLAKKNADVTVQVARAYYNANPTKYTQEITKALEKARKDSKNQEPSIYILEGDMLADQAQYGDAAGHYEMAITYDENNPEGYVLYANAYFNVNKDYALDKLREYLAKHPQSAMVQSELAEKLFKADRWREASQRYGEYIQNPNHFPEDKARYAVLLYWGEDYTKSLSTAEEILAQDPDNFLMQRVRFLDQTALGDYAAAAANAETFFATNTGAAFTVKDYTTYAEALSGLGQDSLAVVQYEIAAEKYPENGDLLKDLSTVYSKAGKHDKSAEAYEKYLQTQENPSLGDRFGMSGRYLNAALKTTDSIKAKDYANRGIEYVNYVIANTPEVTPSMYQRLARLDIAANNKKPDAKAIEAYDKMLALLDADAKNKDPQNPDNSLDAYKEAYAFKSAYAGICGNIELAQEWNKKHQEIKDLLNGTSSAQ